MLRSVVLATTREMIALTTSRGKIHETIPPQGDETIPPQGDETKTPRDDKLHIGENETVLGVL
jgi:hypothetical protein